MQQLNKLLLRQANKYLGGLDGLPENYLAFIQAISESYNHYEKDHRLLERSIELSSEEMIELHEQLRQETEEVKKAHDELKTTEKIRLEKRLDEEKIKNLQETTQAIIEVQEKERFYLAAELHDNINQILATSRLFIDTAINNEEVRLNLIKDSKDFINKAMEEIRHLCKSLLPPSLGEDSLVTTLNEMVQNIRQVNKVHIITDWENIDESKMSDKMKLTVFRIIQEQLNNIFKHAKATTVVIRIIQYNCGLKLHIKDDGIGFDPSLKRNGVGLQNIMSRANLFEGEVILNSSIGAGCELIIDFSNHVKNINQKIAG